MGSRGWAFVCRLIPHALLRTGCRAIENSPAISSLGIRRAKRELVPAGRVMQWSSSVVPPGLIGNERAAYPALKRGAILMRPSGTRQCRCPRKRPTSETVVVFPDSSISTRASEAADRGFACPWHPWSGMPLDANRNMPTRAWAWHTSLNTDPALGGWANHGNV